MYNRTLILFIGLTAFSMVAPGLAQSPNTHTGASTESTADTRHELLYGRIALEDSNWDAYQGKVDALQDTPDKVTSTGNFADRFINPYPELGCLYYDENNVRHWFRYCREL